MKHKLILVLSLFLSNIINAQDSMEFKMQVFPNQTYEIETFTKTKSYMDFEGSEDYLQGFKEQGIELPIVLEYSMFMQSEAKTGNKENNRIPFVNSVKEVRQIQKINGEENIFPNDLEGSIIYGFYDDSGSSKIDSIWNDKLDAETKEMLKNTTEGMAQKIKYPDKHLKIGDTFEQNIPMEVPFADFGTISFIINIEYLLKEIKDDIAFFDTKANFIMTSQITGLELDAEGSGKGFAEYDVKNKFTKNNFLEYSLEMSAQIEAIKIIAKADAESKYTMKLKE